MGVKLKSDNRLRKKMDRSSCEERKIILSKPVWCSLFYGKYYGIKIQVYLPNKIISKLFSKCGATKIQKIFTLVLNLLKQKNNLKVYNPELSESLNPA